MAECVCVEKDIVKCFINPSKGWKRHSIYHLKNTICHYTGVTCWTAGEWGIDSLICFGQKTNMHISQNAKLMLQWQYKKFTLSIQNLKGYVTVASKIQPCNSAKLVSAPKRKCLFISTRLGSCKWAIVSLWIILTLYFPKYQQRRGAKITTTCNCYIYLRPNWNFIEQFSNKEVLHCWGIISLMPNPLYHAR